MSNWRHDALLAAACLGGLAAMTCAPHARAEQPAADAVLRDTGVTAGLAVVVGTTDGALQAGLAAGRTLLVHGLALSDAAAATARRRIFEGGLHGLASVAPVETAAVLPYYDRLVNLLVADLDALGAGAPATNETARVLGYEGVAYLKQGGRWAKKLKPTPPEVDAWTHYHYDASGNPVSRDMVVGPPNAFRWVDGPFGVNLIGGFRTSDGVAVQINPSYLSADRRARARPELQGLLLWARDVNSGVPLWRRPVLPHRSACAYAGTYTESFVAAGGRIGAPPVVHGGRALFGCHDGYVCAVRRPATRSRTRGPWCRRS